VSYLGQNIGRSSSSKSGTSCV